MGSSLALVIAGIASMKAAIDRGDLDDAARQGRLAGPAIVERAIASADRATRLAGIVAAPVVDDRAELLPALARAASGPDRRTAIPAAWAALDIARHLQPADDIADDDIAGWRALFAELAAKPDRWNELRVVALDTAQALAEPGQLGFDVTVFADPDPAIRREAASLVPVPLPAAARAPLATLAHDRDPDVVRAANQALCADDATAAGCARRR
jgi:hypothetical protein